MQISGEYNTADVKSDDGDESAIEQIQEMVDSEAFVGDDNVAVMPDYHWGSGACIGFTMPLGNRVVPNTIGVDIGCGMFAVKLPGYIDLDDGDHCAILDDAIRQRVPTGFNVHDRGDYHMHNDFPWDECQHKLDQFNANSPFEADIEVEYGPEYYDEMFARVGYNPSRIANSIGTLGGGNHFIEIGHGQNHGGYWCIIHSGSRGIGANIAQYWQDVATELREHEYAAENFPEEYADYINFDLGDEDVLDWFRGGKGKSYIDSEQIREDFAENSYRIAEVHDEIREAHPDRREANEDLDYLEGEEAFGYIADMIFAQTYAQENRRLMAEAVLDAWFEDFYPLDYWPEDDPERPSEDFVDTISSVHNYIDFGDVTIRKGACRAHEDERLVIPFNMKAGTLICRGKGDDSWNNSAPHGAGRAMSRTQAKNDYTMEDMEEATEGVYMSKMPLDETPQAYKDPTAIEEAIGPTAEIEERVIPVLNIKAE